MSEPDPAAEEPRPRVAERPAVAVPKASWRGKMGGLLVVGVVAAAALAALVAERGGQLELAAPLRPIEARLEQKRRPKWLAELRAACAKHDCACAKAAARFALDVEAPDVVLEVVNTAKGCAPGTFDGVRAEALVRKGDEAGLAASARALEASPRDPYALYARGYSSYHALKLDDAMANAEESERAGRGWAATLLVGLVAYRTGELDRSRQAFHKLLSSDPDDVEALFNLGVVAQEQNRYGEARSSYLKITRLDPKNADARYNLAILVHSVGASDEAQHHYRTFEKNAPGDPRLGRLREALAKPPEHGPALSLTAPEPVPAASAPEPGAPR
jgi:tetratricopeptide (TPR) repeat protein